MTRFTVTWLEGAQDRLAQIWVAAPNRQAVTAAADTIDSTLATDPGNKGTPVSEGLRTLYVPPLHVLFSIREQDRQVEVASVRSDDEVAPSPEVNGEKKAN